MTSKILWFTGLSGAGKTTLANALHAKLSEKNVSTIVLDGDELRKGLNNNLGFSLDDRQENVRRTAEVAKLFCQQGFTVIVALISPTHALRTLARGIIKSDHFIEVYLSTPLSICEQRDVKGLYKKARNGDIKGFTGIDAPYDVPVNPDIIIDTANVTVEKATSIISEFASLKLDKAE